MFKSWYKLAQQEELYHVTLTEHVPSILEKGIIPQGGPSNWLKGNGERYGIGDVHALQSFKDAVKWASQWDWSLSSSFGSGKVSIVKFKADNDPWDTDDSDPISQSGMDAEWIKRMNSVPPENIIEVIPLSHDLVVQNLQFS